MDWLVACAVLCLDEGTDLAALRVVPWPGGTDCSCSDWPERRARVFISLLSAQLFASPRVFCSCLSFKGDSFRMLEKL